MPLPNLVPALQCTAKSKRSGQRCNNLAAYGCKTCRMHGARKPRSIKSGEEHPLYIHGRETQGARALRSDASGVFHRLWDLGVTAKMFEGKLRGRRPV